MSLLFTDSFDHYTTLSDKYDTTAPNMVITTAAARTGLRGAQLSSFFNGYAVKNIPNTTTIYVGFAFEVVSMASSVVWSVLTLQDSGTNQIIILMSPSGIFTVQRNNVFLGTATVPITFGAWHYIEVKVVIDNSAGIAEVKVDGNFVIQLSGLDTQNTANAWVNSVGFGYQSVTANGTVTQNFDDIYVLDTNGTTNNTYLGDVSIGAILPNANGTENDFSKGGSSIGASNFSQVSENPPDGDTSYVVSPTIGNIDRYTYPAISPTTGTVYAVVVWNRARKDDTGGTRTIRAAAKSSGTIATSPTDLTLSVSYQYLMGLFETDPNGVIPWTLPNVAAAEFGVKVTA